ncbi:hypothetical protein TA5114_01645 [Cognatishimia activa]|nr:hypothetical protein TA5114_01645 [Cognatishimia activa]
MAHDATNQVTEEEIVKLYYDYALGAGNGALVDGRKVSSFAFQPSWEKRPMPPRDKYETTASDEDLGLFVMDITFNAEDRNPIYVSPNSG